MYVCVCVWVGVCVHACVCVCACMHACVCVRARARVYIRVRWLHHVSDTRDRDSLFLVSSSSLLLSLPSCSWVHPLPLIGMVCGTESTDTNTHLFLPPSNQQYLVVTFFPGGDLHIGVGLRPTPMCKTTPQGGKNNLLPSNITVEEIYEQHSYMVPR